MWATQKNEKVNAMRAAHSLPIALHRVCRFYRILTDLFANNRELHSVLSALACQLLRVRPLRAARGRGVAAANSGPIGTIR